MEPLKRSHACRSVSQPVGNFSPVILETTVLSKENQDSSKTIVVSSSTALAAQLAFLF
jgi:hypothetical protein